MAKTLTVNLSEELYSKFLLFLHNREPVELPEFGDYARRKYPKLDGGMITLIEGLIERGKANRAQTPPARVLLMRELRDHGHSLQAIADRFGISKWRVSELLTRHFGSTQVPMLSRPEVAKRFGCSPTAIFDLERQGILNPVHFEGEGFHYYPEQEMGKISRLLVKRCSICGKPIPYSRRKYCADCAGEVRRLSRGYQGRRGEALRIG